MKNKVSYRLLLLVGLLSVSIFSLNTFVILPAAVLSNHPQQLLQSAFGTFPGENGKIAFYSDRDGNSEIYVMNADGSEQTNISNHHSIDSDPSWSPDGTKIAFISYRDFNGEIYVMDAEDGSEQTNISNNRRGHEGFPDWGPAIDSEQPPQPDPLAAEITSSPTEADAPATFEFEAIVVGGTSPYSYHWDFGDGTTEAESIESTTSHTYEEPGIYTVTGTITDANGQQASDSVQVTVNEPEPEPSNPAQATEELISDIQNLQGVSQSTKTSLSAPLRGVVTILNDDNPNNDNSACGRFGAFLNQINVAERRGSLTTVQADDLRTQGEDTRSMLDC